MPISAACRLPFAHCREHNLVPHPTRIPTSPIVATWSPWLLCIVHSLLCYFFITPAFPSVPPRLCVRKKSPPHSAHDPRASFAVCGLSSVLCRLLMHYKNQRPPLRPTINHSMLNAHPPPPFLSPQHAVLFFSPLSSLLPLPMCIVHSL